MEFEASTIQDCAELAINVEAFKYMEMELEVSRDQEYARKNERKRERNEDDEDLAEMMGVMDFRGGKDRVAGANGGTPEVGRGGGGMMMMMRRI